MYALFRVTSDYYSFSNLLAVSEDLEMLKSLGVGARIPMITVEEEEDQMNDHEPYYVIRETIYIKGKS